MNVETRIIKLYGPQKLLKNKSSPVQRRTFKILPKSDSINLEKTIITYQPPSPKPLSPFTSLVDEARYRSPELYRCGNALIPMLSSPDIQKLNQNIIKKIQSFHKIGYTSSRNIRQEAAQDILAASFKVKHSASRIKDILNSIR